MQTVLMGVHPRALLSLLWVFFLFNLVFMHLHLLVATGFLARARVGELAGQILPDALLLLGAVAIGSSLLMVIASLFLPRPAVRMINPIGVALAAALMGLTPSMDPGDMFFLGVAAVALVGIAWVGWALFQAEEERRSPVTAILSVFVVAALVWIAWSGIAPSELRARGPGS